MTNILTLVRTQPSPRTSPSPSTSKISKDAAEAACAPFLAKARTAGKLDQGERRAMIEAVINASSIDHDRRVPMPTQPSVHALLLVEGWALRSHTLANGSRSITDIMLPGDFFEKPPNQLQDAGQHIRACGSTRLALIRKEVFDGAAFPALSRSWKWVRDVDVQTLRFRLVSLGRRDARGRVAHLLSELRHRLHRAGLSEGNAFECPLTQEQLADVLGLTSVHVNRVLQALGAKA